jgi:hypothetical protein
MKKLKSYHFTFIVISLVFFSSCSKDDDQITDVREQIIGDYSYSADIISGDGIEFTVTGDLSVSKHATDQNILIFTGDEIETFFGDKIAVASNGFTFDIPSKQFTDAEGDVYISSGAKGITLGSSKYDGMYETSTKKLILTFSDEYENPDFAMYNIYYTIEATKK